MSKTMNSINSNIEMDPEIYAIQKEITTQGQGLIKLFDSIQASSSQSTASSSSSATGLGQTLDIKG